MADHKTSIVHNLSIEANFQISTLPKVVSDSQNFLNILIGETRQCWRNASGEINGCAHTASVAQSIHLWTHYLHNKPVKLYFLYNCWIFNLFRGQKNKRYFLNLLLISLKHIYICLLELIQNCMFFAAILPTVCWSNRWIYTKNTNQIFFT